MKRVIVFFHIEKCGGTSLVEFFRNNLPFRACEAVSKSNVMAKGEWERTLKVYPALRVLSGHNLPIDVIDWFEANDTIVDSFTILRHPIERVISDYLHDRRKVTFEGSLERYGRIPWKQNYIARFLGGGDTAQALTNIKRIGDLVSIQNSAHFVKSLLHKHGIYARVPYSITNTAPDDLPKDVVVEDGYLVGRYRISNDVYQYLLDVNSKDLALWEYFKSHESAVLGVDETPAAEAVGSQDRWLPRLASMQRNLIYKPLMGVRSKHYSLPRNRSDPSAVHTDDAFQ